MFLSLRAYLSCFPGDSDCRVCLQCGRLRFDPCVGKIPSSRQPTPVFLLENPMDVGAWWATVHGVSKSGARLNDSHTHTHTHQLSFLRQRAGLSLPSFFVVAVCSYLILLLLLIYMYFTSCMPIPKLNGILLIMKDMLVKMEHEKGKSYYIYLQP